MPCRRAAGLRIAVPLHYFTLRSLLRHRFASNVMAVICHCPAILGPARLSHRLSLRFGASRCHAFAVRRMACRCISFAQQIRAVPSLLKSFPRLAFAMPCSSRLRGTMPLPCFAYQIHASARLFGSLPCLCVAAPCWARRCHGDSMSGVSSRCHAVARRCLALPSRISP